MNKLKYRLTRKKISRMHPDGPSHTVVIMKGDVFVPTDSELRDFGDRLEIYEGQQASVAQPVPKPPPAAAPKEAPKADPAGVGGNLIKEKITLLSIPNVKKAIKAKRFTPDAVLAAERTGLNRPTLVKWLRSRV
jgi:hypothetical protein